MPWRAISSTAGACPRRSSAVHAILVVLWSGSTTNGMDGRRVRSERKRTQTVSFRQALRGSFQNPGTIIGLSAFGRLGAGFPCLWHREASMASRAAELVAEIIDRLEDRSFGTGRPPLPTVEVVEALRFFVREGVQWRELRAAAGRACGSTLRRRLDGWSATALLRRVHVVLVRMVRSGPEIAPWDVVVDSCSVRAKRGGELTGPNPTDRGKPGTKHQPRRGLDRRHPAGGRPLGRQRPRHAALPPSPAPGPGCLRRHRQAVRRRGLRQRRQPPALPAGRHPAPHPEDRRAARLRPRLRPLRRRARLRVVAGQQAAGPTPGQAGPHDPGSPRCCLHPHHREPQQRLLKTVP
jgi:transposase